MKAPAPLLLAVLTLWALPGLANPPAAPAGAVPAQPPAATAAPVPAIPSVAAPVDEVARRQLARLQDEVKDFQARLSRLESQLRNQGLLNLLAQVQDLQAEVARLRGLQEEAAHAQQQSDKRARELYADLDDRMRELASRPPQVVMSESVRLQPTPNLTPASPPIDSEAEARAYEGALTQFRVGNYAGAVSAFLAFLKAYPEGSLAGNAQYWLGLSYFAQSDFKSAAAAQLRLLKDFPQSPKVPDAMVSLARARIQLGEAEIARNLLEEVMAKYPISKAAETARKMLTTLN